jgi:hypothetical protein
MPRPTSNSSRCDRKDAHQVAGRIDSISAIFAGSGRLDSPESETVQGFARKVQDSATAPFA